MLTWRNISVFNWPENCPTVSADDDILIYGGRLFHANGPATKKLHGPKPAVLVRGTTRSPWSAECKRWCVETAKTRLIIDIRYLYTNGQILKSTHCRTRSKWRLSRVVGVIQAYFLFLTTRCAETFSTSWSGWRWTAVVRYDSFKQ